MFSVNTLTVYLTSSFLFYFLSDIYSDIPFNILFGIWPDILSGICFDFLSGIHSDILFGIISCIYSNFLSGIYPDILFGACGWGPAQPTEMWKQLKSGSAH